MSARIIVAPSLLAADFARFGDECQRAISAGADWLHLDIMDGHFVNNISFGPELVKVARRICPNSYLDTHLMIEEPERYLSRFAETINSGFKGKEKAGGITIHLEAKGDKSELLGEIRRQNLNAGLAINPPTNAELCEPYFPFCDLLLVMTVNPGFGGQAFMHEVLPKFRYFADFFMKSGNELYLEVDGGVDLQSAPLAIAAGANVLAAGSSVFRAKGESAMRSVIDTLRQT